MVTGIKAKIVKKIEKFIRKKLKNNNVKVDIPIAFSDEIRVYMDGKTITFKLNSITIKYVDSPTVEYYNLRDGMFEHYRKGDYESLYLIDEGKIDLSEVPYISLYYDLLKYFELMEDLDDHFWR